MLILSTKRGSVTLLIQQQQKIKVLNFNFHKCQGNDESKYELGMQVGLKRGHWNGFNEGYELVFQLDQKLK